ncbi:MAG: hypothetical protein Q8920_05010 [Bacillota bacterium]|nr:hypothetical protein [Bacillota bacterium]
MSANILYSRDLLYITENLFEPGSVHMEVLGPTGKGKMPVIIETKTSHSPVKYMDTIIRSMQTDIFDRININVKKNINLYIDAKDNSELLAQYDNSRYIKAEFDGDHIKYSGVNNIDE